MCALPRAREVELWLPVFLNQLDVPYIQSIWNPEDTTLMRCIGENPEITEEKCCQNHEIF
jgi:hypothetical protein